MATITDQIFQSIASMPENIETDDVMEELNFRIQLDARCKKIDIGQGITRTFVNRQISKWLKN